MIRPEGNSGPPKSWNPGKATSQLIYWLTITPGGIDLFDCFKTVETVYGSLGWDCLPGKKGGNVFFLVFPIFFAP